MPTRGHEPVTAEIKVAVSLRFEIFGFCRAVAARIGILRDLIRIAIHDVSALSIWQMYAFLEIESISAKELLQDIFGDT